jgi:dUTP pyrophosphatase
MPTCLTEQSTVAVEVHRLPHAPADLPAYKTPGAAGMDVAAAIDAPITLQPMERHLIPTGLIVQIPEGYEIQLRARSGLAIKHGITLVNGVGTIDADYRDEVKVALINLSPVPFTIQPGDRIAQMLLAPVVRVEWQEIEAVTRVAGREGGFGSTGI